MASQVTYVGYNCPICKQRVVVLSSLAPPTRLPISSIESECQCGYALRIAIDQIQTLDTWRESASVL